MAIDLRQEQQQRQHPATPPRRRSTIWMVAMALAAVFAVGALVTVVALQDEPAPAGEITTVSYPEGAFTSEREGGPYLVVPEPVAGFTDTSVQIREGGSYGLTAEFTDTAVADREGGSYGPTAGYADTSVQIREG